MLILSGLFVFLGVCYLVALHNSHTIYSISQFDLTGLAAALTNESATSKSVYFEHCTSEMIFIVHLIAEEPERLAGPLSLINPTPLFISLLQTLILFNFLKSKRKQENIKHKMNSW